MMTGRRITEKGREVQNQVRQCRNKGREVQCQLILKSLPGGVNQSLLHLGSVCGMC